MSADLHQEDFCQALGRPPAAKYEFNGTGTRGPSIADMFALVRQHMTARDITRLLDAVIFNIAIGNVDSHAKNYSILLGSECSAACSALRPDVRPRLGQHHAEPRPGHWRPTPTAATSTAATGAAWLKPQDWQRGGLFSG
jgi:hypothetical protein